MKNTDSFSALKLSDFLNRLGSAEPAPGGGAAAGLTCAAGAALGEMAARLNATRLYRKKEDPKPSLKIAAAFKKERASFLELMTKDVRAFKKLSAFSKEKRAGSSYQKALKEAALAPLQMCRLSQSSIQKTLAESKRTSAWLYSDILESSILLEAGFLSARLNVEINLCVLGDKKFSKKISAELKKAKTSISKTRSAVAAGDPARK